MEEKKELITYVLKYYGGLMNKNEREYINYINGLERIKEIETNETLTKNKKNLLIEKINETYLHNLNLEKLSKYNREDKLVQITQRIMEENPEIVFLNKCPKCGRLTRTPKSRQCHSCGHKW